MSKTIIRDSRKVQRSRKKSNVQKIAAVRETKVLLFGSKSDPEIKESIRKAELTREVELQLRPSYDTGAGQCGKHLCHCKGNCMMAYIKGTPLETAAA
jgi:hypothetical protein